MPKEELQEDKLQEIQALAVEYETAEILKARLPFLLRFCFWSATHSLQVLLALMLEREYLRVEYRGIFDKLRAHTDQSQRFQGLMVLSLRNHAVSLNPCMFPLYQGTGKSRSLQLSSLF